MSYDSTISIAKGLILANDRTLLKENGGNIHLTTSWAYSIHQELVLFVESLLHASS